MKVWVTLLLWKTYTEISFFWNPAFLWPGVRENCHVEINQEFPAILETQWEKLILPLKESSNFHSFCRRVVLRKLLRWHFGERGNRGVIGEQVILTRQSHYPGGHTRSVNSPPNLDPPFCQKLFVWKKETLHLFFRKFLELGISGNGALGVMKIVSKFSGHKVGEKVKSINILSDILPHFFGLNLFVKTSWGNRGDQGYHVS